MVAAVIRENRENNNDIEYAESAITKDQWGLISQAAGNIGPIATKAFESFGYSKASEIKQKDLNAIIKKASELAKEGV